MPSILLVIMKQGRGKRGASGHTIGKLSGRIFVCIYVCMCACVCVCACMRVCVVCVCKVSSKLPLSVYKYDGGQCGP